MVTLMCAHVRKPQAIRAATGMNQGSLGTMPLEHAQMLASGGDNVPAMVHDQSGTPMAPAALKQGEIVFSVEAVVGAGNGDYNKGAEILLALHEKLKQHGAELLQQNSLARAQ